ncbi:squalene/phytoene synthase family protein [Corynebacterium silvaticum]|nr:squalene/phytoene synthase family protein [Corynebacterium silvaticum]UWH00255.1 squalene/phytoene synthase family protein [Corynebacterium silvaticum]UWH02297.1 squalene/phytoene synthase family protein [Corynebacterium silvaticum]UWH04335.1 squalene/phytoene synthase family protein [Corynebacterium silvaticum]UXZ26496.1 squalene/phytoene synthase family protein [Corynebacterium silvaticum]
MSRWPLRKNHRHPKSHRFPLLPPLSGGSRAETPEALTPRRARGSALAAAFRALTTLARLRGRKSGERGLTASRNLLRAESGENFNEGISVTAPATTSLENFDRMSIRAAEKVITSYSTSFSFATHILEPELRTDIRNLYAMVRTADEIVDGTARAAGLTTSQTAELLADYEREVLLAPTQRLHVDPVMHAYAISARRCQFKEEHVRAFFASMRRDISSVNYNADEDYRSYIYGSAEVIGLMCLSAFLVQRPSSPHRGADQRAHHYSQKDLDIMSEGARALGAAFQKVNFLRDWQEDATQLGRHYFPGAPRRLTDSFKRTIIADIRTDLAAALRAIPLLPGSAPVGVAAAAELFAELTNILDTMSAAEIMEKRASVPISTKARIMARALIKARKFHPLTHGR